MSTVGKSFNVWRLHYLPPHYLSQMEAYMADHSQRKKVNNYGDRLTIMVKDC